MNSRDKMVSSKFDQFLREIPDDHKLGVIRPGGNHGDTLIYMGLEDRLDELDISYTSKYYFDTPNFRNIYKIKRNINELLRETRVAPFKIPNFGDIDHLYIHGGGNMTDLYPGVLKMLETIFNVYSDIPITIGPQSYYFESTDFHSIISQHQSKLQLFCREKYSMEILEYLNISNIAPIKLSPDTAFYLQHENLREYVDREILEYHELSPGEYTLLAFRDDLESTLDNDAVLNISNQIDGPQFQYDISTAPNFSQFITLLDSASYIYTDRLHGGILSSILNKKVTLIENSYHKSRGVYEYILSDCENINFISSKI